MLSLICIYIHRNFIKLLSVPLLFTKDQKGGGRPVKCYDLDDFNLAYAVSQSLLENNEKSDSIQYFLEILKKSLQQWMTYLWYCQLFGITKVTITWREENAAKSFKTNNKSKIIKFIRGIKWNLDMMVQI